MSQDPSLNPEERFYATDEDVEIELPKESDQS